MGSFLCLRPTTSDISSNCSATEERPRNIEEWHSLTQLSGAPTRLLDCTEGALITPRFAVRNKERDDTGAAVWVLDPWEMNRSVVDRAEVIVPGEDIAARSRPEPRSAALVHRYYNPTSFIDPTSYRPSQDARLP
jgi:hypothetical protein